MPLRRGGNDDGLYHDATASVTRVRSEDRMRRVRATAATVQTDAAVLHESVSNLSGGEQRALTRDAGQLL